ncbi:MAG: RNase adapter RapZ [Oscillospiraceae bacterium]|nr:RNase adapter RapZ [Oscillospiraceae bacterium]
MELLIVSGLSGAGKSRVAGELEDIGFYCVDNLPVLLMPTFAEVCLATRGKYERVALVTDVRNVERFSELFDALAKLRELGVEYRILFVEASVDTIVKRYMETRRRHPLFSEEIGLEETVRHEIELLKPVREAAEYIIDTTGLTLTELQRRLYSIFANDKQSDTIQVSVVSFGFKHGIPLDADLVFNVRFLPNPYYVPELKKKTGLDPEVSEYVLGFDIARKSFAKIEELILFLLPQYVEEGRHSLVVCVGCTGGHHRSVVAAEKLRKAIADAGYHVQVQHRDITKN